MTDEGHETRSAEADHTTSQSHDNTHHLVGPNPPQTRQDSYACIAAISGTLNPLFKVLCTFPSRYLFAIGLEEILSFGWNVPPTLRSHLREHDSENVGRTRHCHRYETGISPSMSPVAKGLVSGHPLAPRRNTTVQCSGELAFWSELFPIRSPLLGESSSVSTPPLTNMLKFSGWSSPRSGQIIQLYRALDACARAMHSVACYAGTFA